MINGKEQTGKNRIRMSKNRNKTVIEINFDKTLALQMQIDLKLGEIEYLNLCASKTENLISYTGSRTRRSKSKIEECICKIIEIEESAHEDMETVMELKSQSMSVINKISDPELRSLLINRYIYGKKWDEVAVLMNYSNAHVFRLHNDALAKLREIENDINNIIIREMKNK